MVGTIDRRSTTTALFRRVAILSDTQRLPNLYQLLGLTGLESNREKIVAALKRAQAKAAALQADTTRTADAARLQKVIALGQKYLLSPALKSSYDTQWKSIYGAVETTAPAAPERTVTSSAAESASTTTAASSASVASATAQPTLVSATSRAAERDSTNQLFWDMATLEALLPAADPRAPFQMADYLRTSQVRDPMAAEADLRKLISLLGGEELPMQQPVVSQPLAEQSWSDEPSLPAGNAAEDAPLDTGVTLPRSTNNAAAANLAKRMRKKRQQAMLFGGTMLAAAIGGLVLLSIYLNRPAVKSDTEPLAQSPKSVQPRVTPPPASLVPTDPEKNLTAPAVPSGLELPQLGDNLAPMAIQATPMQPDANAMKSDGMKSDAMKPDAMKPDAMANKPAGEPMKTEPPKTEPPKTEPAKTEPPKTEPMKPEDAKPEAAADVKLNAREKKAWQDEMKRARAALSKLDPAATDKQIVDLTPLAKTAAQKAHLAQLEQVAALMRKAREAIVAGIGGLDGAQSFTVGNSTEVSFIEGDETRIIVKAAGSRQEYKIESIPLNMGVALMKLQPNVIDANMDAAMGAYILAQPKKPSSAAAQAKKLLEEAAAAGAIPKDLAQFYEEDFKL